MKKRVTLLTIVVVMMLSVMGCGKKELITQGLNYKVSDFVKLGKYEGVEVVLDSTEVTEEDLEAAIQAELSAKSTQNEITKGEVSNGDTVNIDYEGLLDGVAFEGGTAEAFDLTIGSGSFIEGFEEQLVGVKVGDTVNLDVTFPEEYGVDELNGQDVVFKVTVNHIVENIVPELNEEFVTTNTDYKTIEEFKEGLNKDLIKENEESISAAKVTDAWTTAVTNATIKNYPEEEIKEALDNIKEYYEQYASYYGMEYADFLEQMGLTEENFDEEMKKYAEESVAQMLVFYAIVEDKKMTLSESEYKEGLKKYMEDAGATDEEEFIKTYTKEYIEEQLLFEKVQNHVAEKAKEVDELSKDTSKEDSSKEDTSKEK